MGLINQPGASRIHLLTKREREIVKLVIQGGRNKDVARSLSIAEHTVEQHLVHIYQKLNIQSRIELTNYYHKQIVPYPDE